MRYYAITFTKDDGSIYTLKSLGGMTLTSLLPSGPQNPVTGSTNPAALQIELDIAVANLADPDNNQGAGITVWGLSLEDLGNAADLNGLNISVYGGMAAGLPLADPKQAGLLCSGSVLQSFGNWVGTDQTLNLILAQGGTATGVVAAAQNFPFVMPAGTALDKAVTATLAIALPAIPVVMNVSPNLVLNRPESGQYGSFSAFSQFIKEFSQGILGGDYDGVSLTTNGSTVVGFDGLGKTSDAQPTPVAFQDLIGQPTWIGTNTVSVKTVLRSDIHMGDYISLPQTLFTQTTSANQRWLSNPQNKLTFNGTFQVVQVHHYGHSRQPDAASWNTTLQAVRAIPPSSAADSTVPFKTGGV